MGIGETVGDLGDETERLRHRERARLLEQLVQVGALDELGRDVEAVLVLSLFVDLDHVRRVEGRQHPCLTEKAGPERRLVRELGRQELQCDRSVEARLASLEHRPHAALADAGDDAVTTELFSGLREMSHGE